MIQIEYHLTPNTGDKILEAERAAEQANVMALLDGDGMMYTSLGHNMASRLASAPLRREARLDHGAVSIGASPTVDGLQLVIPRMAARIEGESFLLEGPELLGAQRLDFSNLSSGAYAVVLESWVALVGPTTLGKATRPAQYAGVEDAAGKPSKDTLYAAGNIERGAQGAVGDEPFVTATIQTQKMLQRQYRLRVIPDRNLAGYVGIDNAEYAADPRVAPHGVSHTVPHGSGDAYARAYDRRFVAFKLCVVERAGTELRLHVQRLLAPDTYLAAGQAPAPIIPTLGAALREIYLEHEALRGEAEGLRVRLSLLENRLEYAEAVNPQAQTLQTAAQAPAFQRLVLTEEQADAPGWHDTVTNPSVFIMDFEGRVIVQVSASFAQSALGSRRLAVLLNNAAARQTTLVPPADAPCDLTLSCELDVVPGDRIEAAGWHTAPGALNLLAGSRVSVRRLF